MVFYSEYHNLLWFTIVNTMLHYGLLQCLSYFTIVYYCKYHNLLWLSIANSMLYYHSMVYYNEDHILLWFTTVNIILYHGLLQLVNTIFNHNLLW